MPAINPSLLERQIGSTMEEASDAVRFVRSIRELLEFYADRTKRSTRTSEALIFGRVLRVPKPVMQAITGAIHTRVALDESVKLVASQMLWDIGQREPRMIAVSLMSSVNQAEIARRFELWASDCDDDEVLRWIAREGLAGWRRQPEPSLWLVLGAWLDHRSGRVQLLAIHCLHAAMHEWQDDAKFPQVFELLRARIGNLRGAPRAGFQDLIQTLARRSPQETARFLMDEHARKAPDALRMLRASLDAFPAALRAELEALLSPKV